MSPDMIRPKLRCPAITFMANKSNIYFTEIHTILLSSFILLIGVQFDIILKRGGINGRTNRQYHDKQIRRKFW